MAEFHFSENAINLNYVHKFLIIEIKVTHFISARERNSYWNPHLLTFHLAIYTRAKLKLGDRSECLTVHDRIFSLRREMDPKVVFLILYQKPEYCYVFYDFHSKSSLVFPSVFLLHYFHAMFTKMYGKISWL